jgi:CRISPR-associated protein Cas1
MAASFTVPQVPSGLNSSTASRPLLPTRGVVTLFGYGIRVHVYRGHLVVEDGIGPDRRHARFSRVAHGLRRLTVIGADGAVSLAALRWLADQKAGFVMLDRDGTVLVATGPIGPKDARLRRAQALARGTSLGLQIAKDLIELKLVGQERIACDTLHDPSAAAAIGAQRQLVAMADTLDAIRIAEARAGLAYWGCWRSLQVSFPTRDLPRIPNHWRTFGTRISPLTHSPRLSVNPPNAILNYLYALLESEARLAAVAMGLDPGLGVLHADTDTRDSLACDLMEPIRPHVDAFLLNWLARQPFRREWFFEQRTGNCRLMATFAEQLAKTTSLWAHAVAPVAERVVKALWSTAKRKAPRPATRLTQQHRREANGSSIPLIPTAPRPPRVCRSCGVGMPSGETHCAACDGIRSRDRMRAAAIKGRVFAQTAKAQARRTSTRLRNVQAEAAWKPSDQPSWLTKAVFSDHIQPKLSQLSARRLASTLHISESYAADIRAGRRRPHPRHWFALAALTRVEPDTNR